MAEAAVMTESLPTASMVRMAERMLEACCLLTHGCWSALAAHEKAMPGKQRKPCVPECADSPNCIVIAAGPQRTED